MIRRVADTKAPSPAPATAPAPKRAPPQDEVRRALGSPWQQPTPELRAQLRAEHGVDFAEVRMHTDERAGASALALGAEAYTVGSDMVFAPGAFAPHSARGRELIAHEAVHVQQQGGQRYSGGALEVESPGASGEREAQSLVQRGATGGAALRAAPRRSGGVRVQRSLLGAGIGGLLGGVALGLLGGLLGPAGAVIGAIVGTVGGAILGDLATRRTRSLAQPERDYLWDIYRDSVDYGKVTITRNSIASTGAARTLGNTINLQNEHFKGDTMELSDAGLRVLAHEMGHVWQYQNGGLAYIPSSLIPQITAFVRGESRNAAYDWRQAAAKTLPWHEWNAEQQAECISDYNEALRKVNAGTARPEDYQTCALALPYIELVRQRIGAPGASRRTTASGAGMPASGGHP
jgi:hypothetical protein